ncbi:MAG: hypothetical protein V1781_00695 [Bacteroidota bacterium]
MNNTVKNTSFDNLVNYQTPYSNSTIVSGAIQSSSDPNSLAFQIQNQQLVIYNLAVQVEKTMLQSDKENVSS